MSFLSIADARSQIDLYIYYYNHKRLHSAICYIVSGDFLSGKRNEIFQRRDNKLLQARMKKIQIYNERFKSSQSCKPHAVDL